ncbi:hypothetical protein C4J83_5572 [Pseudomonas sp. LBUM920]|nr:hypothetical protein C4J83_5572 [Pseudomonas sp. LBUM920]
MPPDFKQAWPYDSTDYSRLNTPLIPVGAGLARHGGLSANPFGH